VLSENACSQSPAFNLRERSRRRAKSPRLKPKRSRGVNGRRSRCCSHNFGERRCPVVVPRRERGSPKAPGGIETARGPPEGWKRSYRPARRQGHDRRIRHPVQQPGPAAGSHHTAAALDAAPGLLPAGTRFEGSWRLRFSLRAITADASSGIIPSRNTARSGR